MSRNIIGFICVASRRRGTLLGAVVFAMVLSLASSVRSQAETAEDEIRGVVAKWYVQLAKRDQGQTWELTAPGYIEATPSYTFEKTGSAAAGPRIHTSLSATALHFAYDIEAVTIDPNFAKVIVWERGYFYAFAAKRTYERAASTIFVMERQTKDQRWLILAHQSNSVGIPPNKVTRPMPDMRRRYCETTGKPPDCAGE